MSVMSGQEATDKPEPAVTEQGAGNAMVMEKGMHSPTMLVELCRTNDASSTTCPYKHTFYMSRCKLALAVNLT